MVVLITIQMELAPGNALKRRKWLFFGKRIQIGDAFLVIFDVFRDFCGFWSKNRQNRGCGMLPGCRRSYHLTIYQFHIDSGWEGWNSPASNSLLRGGRSYAEGAPARRALLRGGRAAAEGAPPRRALLRGLGGLEFSRVEFAPARRALLRGGRSYAEGAPTRRALLRGGRSYAEARRVGPVG